MKRISKNMKRCTNVIMVMSIVLVLLGTNSLAYTLMFSPTLNKSFMGIRNPPLYFTLFNEFSSATVNAIHNANTTWNNGGVGDLVYRYTNRTHNFTPTTWNNYSSNDGINRISKGEFGTGGGLIAETRIWGTEKNNVLQIIEADMVLNVSYSYGTGVSSNYYDVETVVLHELGHAIGLDHSIAGSVMEQGIPMDVNRRTLSQDDINVINFLY